MKENGYNKRLLRWLDAEFIPEAVNQKIAQRAAQIFVRQRMEGENDLGSLVIAIVTEMQAFDFSKSFLWRVCDRQRRQRSTLRKSGN